MLEDLRRPLSAKRRPNARPKQRLPRRPMVSHRLHQRQLRSWSLRWVIILVSMRFMLQYCSYHMHWPICIYIYIYMGTTWQLFQRGSALKKELSSVTSVFLELPPGHALRETLGAYKTRFEEYMDEILGLSDFQFAYSSEFLSIRNCQTMRT